MTGSINGFGGQGYTTQESRALSSIEETPGADLSQGQDAQIKMLQSHDYQIKFLAQQMKQAQTGINKANQNPIQQVEQFISDIIILLGGGQLAEGALDFGDLQYILPALGALFGFGDGPFPISLFEAAEKFFLGYVVPNAQFVDVINGIIQAWLGLLGVDPKFIKDVKSLITAFGDLFDGIENLLPSLNELFSALGISGGDLGPFGQVLGPIIKLFTGLDLSKVGNIIEFITSAIDPFIVQLTAIIDFIDSVLAVFGYSGGTVVNSPIGDTTLPFSNLLGFLGDINFASPDFNILTAATSFITNILNPTGLLATVESVAQAIEAAIQQLIDMLFNGLAGGDASGVPLGILGAELQALQQAAQTATSLATRAFDITQQFGGLLHMFIEGLDAIPNYFGWFDFIAQMEGVLATTVSNIFTSLSPQNPPIVSLQGQIDAALAHINSGTTGINYLPTTGVLLSDNYPGTSKPSFTAPTGFSLPTVVTLSGTPPFLQDAGTHIGVFTGDPSNLAGTTGDHGLATNRNHIEVTIIGTAFGTVEVFMCGHGTTTVTQYVSLNIAVSGPHVLSIITYTGANSGANNRLSVTLPAALQANDVVAMEYDDVKNFTLFINGVAVPGGVWDETGAGLNHGAGDREIGYVTAQVPGFGPVGPQLGRLVAYDY